MNFPNHRRTTLGASAICIALIAALGVAGAGAEVNPAGGSDFEGDIDGWANTRAQCQFGGADNDGGLCNATGENVPAGGNPGGALRARTEVVVNAGGLFTSEHTFISPSFVLRDQFDGAFSYDRRLVPGPLVALGVRAEVEIVLVNDTTAAETLIAEDPLGEEDGGFVNKVFGVPPSGLEQNGSYHIELRVRTGTDSAQTEVLGTTDALFDNIRFVTSDEADGTAGGPGSGPGTAPGGSVTLLRKCTVLGTEGDDRITGTKKTDIVCALGGDDVVKTKGAPDVIDGADGNDVARGGKKADLLLGVKGNDKLFGSKGADRLLGAKGRDVLKAGADNDNISAADGERDLVDGGSGKRNRARTDSKDKVKRVQRLLGD